MGTRFFDVIFFDLGNTLLYFDADFPTIWEESRLALWHSLREHGIEIEKGKIMGDFYQRLIRYHAERDNDFIELTTESILKEILDEQGIAQPAAVIRAALDAMYAITEKHWIIEDDTRPTLELLRAQGYRLGIISNAGDHRDVQMLLENAVISLYFDLILSSAAIGIRKPHPRIFQVALEHFNTTAARCVMVGDTLNADILGAQRIGMANVWIRRRAFLFGSQSSSRTIHPDAVIDRLDGLPFLLQEWESRNTQ